MTSFLNRSDLRQRMTACCFQDLELFVFVIKMGIRDFKCSTVGQVRLPLMRTAVWNKVVTYLCKHKCCVSVSLCCACVSLASSVTAIKPSRI